MVTAAMKLEDNCFLAAIMTVMTHLDSMLKSKDISLPTKVHIVNALDLVVVMYGCMNWAIRRQNTKQSMLSNCGAREDSWESLREQGDQSSQS